MRPSIIFTWPSNLRAIALELEHRRERLPIAALATSAELSTAGLRSDCERIFGAVPVDIFGAREIGIIAWRCHAGLNYHLAAESALIEVIRDDGAPARPGETGRLVATPFYNLHTPFIRYETGDYVTLASEPCACGRSLPSMSRICGRARGRLRYSDGREVFPDVPEAALDILIGPLKWQLVQEEMDRLVVYVDPEVMPRIALSSPLIEETIRNAFRADLRVDFYPAHPREVPRRKRELFSSTVSTRDDG
jgi:phenylacetate-CoA ligase